MRLILNMIRSLVTALVAGALGGALLGIAESVLVITTSAAPDEYGLFLFGAVAYGLLGAGLGLAAGVTWQLLRRGRAGDRELARIAIAAGLILPVLAVARYHVAQRLFEEVLPLATPTGLAVHAALLLAAAGVAAGGIALAHVCHRVGGLAALAGALMVALAGAAGVAAIAGAGAPRAPVPHADRTAAGRPNVILIVADTLRADAADRVREERPSGAFAQLAAEGVSFDQTYAQASWTRPSIATILTATYPSVHRTTQKMDFLPDSVLTIAEALQAQGYWTAAFTTNINVAPIFNFQQGFDEFHYLEPSFYFGATDSATRLAIYKGLRAAREKLTSAMWVENYYQDAATVDRAVGAWLAQAPPAPFFLFVHYMDPHDPYFDIPYDGRGVARVSTPDPAAERAGELRELYRQDVHYLDEYLERLVRRLKDQGLYDRSIIAITADHGEEFHEHGGWWHGTALYDEQVHVPLIIKRTGEGEGGRHRTDIARSVDIAPTLLGAAGLAIPEPFAGIDLFAGTVSEPVIADEDLEGNRLSSVRDGEWKLITANRDNPRGLPPVELFDLRGDPAERHDLSADQPARVADLRAQLDGVRMRAAQRQRGAESSVHAARTGP